MNCLRRPLLNIVAAVAVGLIATSSTFAQPQGNGDRPQRGQGNGGPGGQRGGPGGGEGRPMNPQEQKLAQLVGLKLRPVPHEHASELGLKPGVGLTVQDLAADSIAAKAGFLVDDVVTKVADQWVINPPQFSTLLTFQDGGDSKVTVIRKGAATTLSVKLDAATIAELNKRPDGPPRGGPGGGGPGGGGPGDGGGKGPGGNGPDGNGPPPPDGNGPPPAN